MASSPLIFPSLSRQPSMDTTKSTEDDTIRDSMESGYMATRPRFTRARDTFKVNVRNLVEEDKRALDVFVKTKSLRGANSFYYPNLLKNGSFEFPAMGTGDLVDSWAPTAVATPFSVAVTAASVYDGASAITFEGNAQTVAANSTVTAQLAHDTRITCAPGDVFAAAASVLLTQAASQPTNVNIALSASVAVSFYSADGTLLSTTQTAALSGGAATWQAYSEQFTAPANATSFSLALEATAVNTGTAAGAITGSIVWDAAGCALYTPVQLYGRTVGSDALPRAVRFSALPEFSDVGWRNGVKGYAAHFEMTEV